MTIIATVKIEIEIEDLNYRFMLKKELKDVIALIPEDDGMNTVKIFLENIRIRL